MRCSRLTRGKDLTQRFALRHAAAGSDAHMAAMHHLAAAPTPSRRVHLLPQPVGLRKLASLGEWQLGPGLPRPGRALTRGARDPQGGSQATEAKQTLHDVFIQHDADRDGFLSQVCVRVRHSPGPTREHVGAMGARRVTCRAPTELCLARSPLACSLARHVAGRLFAARDAAHGRGSLPGRTLGRLGVGALLPRVRR